jgi:hypothetical protein
MSTRSYQSVSRKTWPCATVGAISLILACSSGLAHSAPADPADPIYVRDHRAAKVFVVPIGRFRDTIVLRETYRDKVNGKGWTNTLYELDCRSRKLRYIGMSSSGGKTTFKESEFYGGMYAKAHDVFCRQYKDPAEWED